MLKCHFIVMASNELTSAREVIISADELPGDEGLKKK
jgi:hypothetical protein